jgi:hypothetical protein
VSENDKTIISRIQQRRGLKADLPTPLRPAELGFATDSRQLFIGADTSDPLSDSFNRSLVFENTISARDRTEQLADIAVVQFTVPHIRFPQGTFDGIDRTVDWAPTAPRAPGSSLPVFSTTVTSGPDAATAIRGVFSGQAFRASDLTVMRSGTLLVGDNTSASSPGSGKDFVFSSTSSASNFHRLTLRAAPQPNDSITVTYYTADSVNQMIETSTIPNSTLKGFYATYPEIPQYRRIDPELVSVSPTSGTGFVGFDSRQLSVYAGGNQSVADPNDLTLTELMVARESDAVPAAATANATVVSITVGPNNYEVDGDYPATFVKVDDVTWLDSKRLDIASVAGNTVIATIPVQDYSLSREVESLQLNANVVSLVGNVSGVNTGDTVFFVNPGGNLENVTATVTGVTSSAFLVSESGIGNISANLSYINRGNVAALGGNTFVQVVSMDHGYPPSTSVNFLTPSAATRTVVGPTTTNTFFVNYGSVLTSNESGTMRPNISGESYTDQELTATPIRAIDLSGVTTLANAVSTVKTLSEWPSLVFEPGSDSRVFFTHKNSFSSTGLEFRLFEQDGTLAELGLQPGFYGFSTTVKAKFEKWINSVLGSTTVNLVTSANTNQPYASTALGNMGTWDLNVNETLSELVFDSRHEAGNFAQTINRIYYQGSGADIRGLVTLKTNIELVTRDSLQTGTATTSIAAPRVAMLPNSVSPLPVDNFSVDGTVFNNLVLEYSLKSTMAAGGFYSRTGQMLLSADLRQNAGDGAVSLSDISSELIEGVSGNVDFQATITDGDIGLSATNTLSPNQPIRFTYSLRRWQD